MRKGWKRLWAAMLVFAAVLSLLPPAGTASAAEVTAPDYASADAVFDRIDAMENQPAKRSATQTQLTDAAVEIVLASDGYVPDSLVRGGDSFTWWTRDGVRCIYSPRMRRIEKDMTPEDTLQNVAVNEPKALKGNAASGNQVYVIGPYYGYDDNFTNQYKNEAARVAAAIGDTDGYTLYSGTAATVDRVAAAVSNGAVVFFDSHGLTDYENGYDCVSYASNSYMCLTSTTGLTKEDYADGALYYDDGICINGATIANHMEKDSPGGILWMALCLGMATNTLCEPLRQRGVEVVYGYSQSVSFYGDYLFEKTFWDEMTKGHTVAESVATMKDTWGSWDWSTQIASYYYYDDGYVTISAARKDYMAFPVVVSDEDTHPGQRYRNSFYGACSLQNVQSAYQLNVVARVPDEEPEIPMEPATGDSATYVFADYQVSGELGGMEASRRLDGTVSAYISSGWFNEQARIYKGAYMIIESDRAMKALVLNAGYKNSTFDVYVSPDGESWTLHRAGVQYSSAYSDITVVLPENCRYVWLDACNAQIRLRSMTVFFAESLTPDTQVPGDLDGDGGVSEDDAVYLLQHCMFPEVFPAAQRVDLTGDGAVNEEDALYLLLHCIFPEDFSL